VGPITKRLLSVCKQHLDNLAWVTAIDYEATEAEVMADPVARAAAMQNRAERAEAQLQQLGKLVIAFCADLSNGGEVYRADMRTWVDRQLMAELLGAAEAAQSAGEDHERA
jgi:hypothetical protein